MSENHTTTNRDTSTDGGAEVLGDTEVLFGPGVEPSEPPVSAHPTPRIRWGSILWGIITCAIAVATVVFTSSPGRRTVFLDWVTTLSTPDFVAIGTVGFGVILLLVGVAALSRRT